MPTGIRRRANAAGATASAGGGGGASSGGGGRGATPAANRGSASGGLSLRLYSDDAPGLKVYVWGGGVRVPSRAGFWSPWAPEAGATVTATGRGVGVTATCAGTVRVSGGRLRGCELRRWGLRSCGQE